MSLTSILVPCLDDLCAFENTLASVLRYRPEDCEVIVIHDGSYTDPHGLQGEITLIASSGSASLIELFNAAVKQIDSQFVHLVRPGIDVCDGWLDCAIPEFDHQLVASVTPLLLEQGSEESILAAGIACNRSMRRRLFGSGGNQKKLLKRARRILGPSSCAAFYRTSVLHQIGPIDASLGDDYLDVEIALSLRNLGYQTRLAVDSRLIGPAGVLEPRISRFHSGRAAQRMIRRHASTDDLQTQTLCRQVLALELATSLVRPANLIAVAGRIAASMTSSEDRQACRRFESVHDESRAA